MGASRAFPTSRRKRTGKKDGQAGRDFVPPIKKETAIRFVPEYNLGTGGLCEVFAAKDLLRVACGDGVPCVAVKRLLPEYARNPAARRLLAREFFVARAVAHPGVVRVFDLHQEEQGVCLSMELLKGRSLYAVQADNPAGLGVAAFPLAQRLFETLAVLHHQGIAHGDIKPANLMLESNNRLVLFDFNTAELIVRPGRASSRISRGLRSNLGLAAYSILHASPERLEGHSPSFADDVFAACCTLYELAEGAHPFARHTSLEARDSGLLPPAMVTWNDRRARLLLRGLSFSPAQRPTARELAEAFRPETFATRWFAWLQTSLNALKES